MRVPPFGNLNPSRWKAGNLRDFGRDVIFWFQQVSRIVNGNLSFGSHASTFTSSTGFRDPSQNLDAVWVWVTFAAPNTNTTINHNLNRLPVGYIPVGKTAACDVFNGSVASTKTQITLQGTVATTVVLLIF